MERFRLISSRGRERHSAQWRAGSTALARVKVTRAFSFWRVHSYRPAVGMLRGAGLHVTRKSFNSNRLSGMQEWRVHVAPSMPCHCRMKEATNITEKPDATRSEEPLGIIISRGSREEPTPIFSTYIWGPAPEVRDGAYKAA